MGVKYPTAREEQAAYWYLELQDPEVSGEEIRAALAWEAEPRNHAALMRVQAFWHAWACALITAYAFEGSPIAAPR